MAVDKNRLSAFKAADRIRVYWRNHPKYKQPKVDVHPGTYEIKSDIVNGYPPLKEA